MKMSPVHKLAYLTLFLIIGPPSADTSSCALVTDAIVDYALDRFLGNTSLQALPDFNTGVVQMSRGRLYGLDTIRRACPIVVTKALQGADNTTHSARVCMKTGVIRLTAVFKVRTLFSFKITEFVDASIDGVEMSAVVVAGVHKGGGIQLEEFDISKLGKITLDNAGLLGSFDKIINVLINTKVKKAVIYFVEKGVRGAIEDELKKIVL